MDHYPNTYDIYNEKGVKIDEKDVDNEIEVALSTDESGDPVIKVTGFDYSNNWCGIKTSGTTQTVQGHKVMILIPIEMNPDAVGGPNVATNGPGSGIYVNEDDTETLIDFDSPTISLPVNIHIVKNGLRPGESAKFKIMRTTLPVSNESEWEYVTSVFVTNGEHTFIYEPTGAPVTYVRGLPSTKLVEGKQVGLVYRVEEEPWRWSYNRSTLPQYTNTENIDLLSSMPRKIILTSRSVTLRARRPTHSTLCSITKITTTPKPMTAVQAAPRLLIPVIQVTDNNSIHDGK